MPLPQDAWARGTWGDPQGAHLVFAEDGTFSGSDGCNPVTGTYTTAGDSVIMRRGLSTLKGCLGVDTWLSEIVTATLDADELVVFNARAERIGTLCPAR